MDRTADPCVDFYQYVCGGWMKNNPIPPDQPSWSVYAKLADENQQFLWGILEEASDPRRARNASEQKIGDFFQACMDEPAIEKLGAAPLETGLGEIAALKSKSDLGKYLGQEHLAIQGSDMLFGFGSNQDFANATQVIAFADSGGLGLPDRDYYTKTDPKSQEIRGQYVRHVQRMFELMGDSSGRRRGEAKTVMAIETALAEKSLTRVQEARSLQPLSQNGSRAIESAHAATSIGTATWPQSERLAFRPSMSPNRSSIGNWTG